MFLSLEERGSLELMDICMCVELEHPGTRRGEVMNTFGPSPSPGALGLAYSPSALAPSPQLILDYI